MYRDAQGRTHQFGAVGAAAAGGAVVATAAEYDLDEGDGVWDEGMEDVQPVFALDDEVV